jgi:putative endonuclease
MDKTKQEIGQLGEKIASDYLKKKGYKILDKNYSKNISGLKLGEIDVVAEKDGTVVFFEVKTKKSKDNIFPEEKINFRKKRNIQKMAEIWLDEKRISQETKWQIDIISVNLDLDKRRAKIFHLRNVNI